MDASTFPSLAEVPRLLADFRAHGGVFDNLQVCFDPDRGLHLRVVDADAEVRLFCPDALLIDATHTRITPEGMRLAATRSRDARSDFMDRYLAFQFGPYAVARWLEEKAAVDALTPRERALLALLELPHAHADASDPLCYVHARMLATNKLGLAGQHRSVLMPFAGFMNHDRDGVPFRAEPDGIHVRGRFSGEVLACYHANDTLALTLDHLLAAPSRFAYSLPMFVDVPDGRRLRIERDCTRNAQTREGHPWPLVEQSDSEIRVSWFPLHFDDGPRYPARFARYLAQNFGLPGELVLQAVYRFNFGRLCYLTSQLRSSANPYVQRLLTGVEAHLLLCTGSEAWTPSGL